MEYYTFKNIKPSMGSIFQLYFEKNNSLTGSHKKTRDLHGTQQLETSPEQILQLKHNCKILIQGLLVDPIV